MIRAMAGQSYAHHSGVYNLYPVIFNATGIVELGVLNAQQGYASQINNAGQVVGNLIFPDDVAEQAFLYQNGQMAKLNQPAPTAGWSNAFAINNNGLIVGGAYFPGDDNIEHAASYFSGKWTDIGTTAFGRSIANSVNDSGTIVGYFEHGSASGLFIYQNGKMSDLGFPGNPGKSPVINNQGQIVATGGYGNDSAYLYNNGAWTNLNDQIAPVSGWTITTASSINNQGVIAGYGLQTISGQTNVEGYILTPVSSNKQKIETR